MSLLSKLQLTPAQRMMGCIAMGDALGTGHEFQSRSVIAETFDPNRYQVHPFSRPDDNLLKVLAGKNGILPRLPHREGIFSDDAQMSLAVAEALLSDQPFSPDLLATSLLTCYQRDPIPGYSPRMDPFLSQSSDPQDFMRKLSINNKSEANGAAIRAVPLGVLPDVARVKEAASINARLTHASEHGYFSSVAVALMSYFFYHQIKGISFYDFVIRETEGLSAEGTRQLKQVRDERAHYMVRHPPRFHMFHEEFSGIDCHGIQTTIAAFYLLGNFSPSPFTLLQRAIGLGGETGATASIGFGIAAIRHSLDRVPDFLFKDLSQEGPYRRDHFFKVGEALGQKFPPRVDTMDLSLMDSWVALLSRRVLTIPEGWVTPFKGSARERVIFSIGHAFSEDGQNSIESKAQRLAKEILMDGGSLGLLAEECWQLLNDTSFRPRHPNHILVIDRALELVKEMEDI